jgi:hypothetical protein
MESAMRAVLLIVLVTACGSAPAPAGDASSVKTGAATRKLPKRTADVTIVVTGERVTFNGVAIGNRPMVADLVAVLGKPDRTWDERGANKIHTWDRLGVLVYEPHDGRCISATFPYKPMERQSFNPTTLFGGSIVVDGKRLSPDVSLAKVKSWPGATTPYTERSVVFDRGDLHVFTIEDAEPLGRIDLVELGFWQSGEEPDVDQEPTAEGRIGVLEAECRAGDARMCTRLALVLQTGTGADQDFERAFGLAKQGCDGGDGFACTMLGNMYQAGTGTDASAAAAREAWQRACSLGDPGGCARAAATGSSSPRAR